MISVLGRLFHGIMNPALTGFHAKWRFDSKYWYLVSTKMLIDI